jgi:2-polyprenyl-6-methoxyphenol hydroxylase-like FAD-dependent oxidoreductase
MAVLPSSFRRHAVIIGASIGGICAAEALAPHFERVTLIERDPLPSGPEPRRGVPQGNQPHGLQLRGRRELDAMFPGLMDALKAEGAFEFNPSMQMARFTPYGWTPRYADVGSTAFAGSRPLLEYTMRRLLLARRANVRIVDSVRVTELVHERRGDQAWVTGVRTDAKDPALKELSADLVVDSTGRGTKAPKWLAQMGLPEPVEIRVDSKCNYATRHYRAPAEAKHWWWRALLIDNDPPTFARACSIFTVEKERWIVTAIGSNGDYAPTDEAGWLAYVKSMRSPVAYELLSRAEPLTEVVQNRTTVNWWKLMHRYDAPLNGLLLFGDAVCGFNPSYGQGMTASALAGQSLGALLAQDAGAIDRRFLSRYYRSQADFLAEGWALSTTMDFRWPKTEGKRPLLYGVTRWATKLLEQIAIHDVHMVRRLLPLADFGAKRWSVLTPDFLARCLVGLARHLVARPTLPASIDLFQPPPVIHELPPERVAAE